MTITLYITLWLLSGFLAAWLTHILIDKRECDLPNAIILANLVLGPIGVLMVLVARLFRMADGLPSIVKAKEPK